MEKQRCVTTEDVNTEARFFDTVIHGIESLLPVPDKQILKLCEIALMEIEEARFRALKALDLINQRYGCQDCQKARQGHWPIYSSTCPQCAERMLEAGKAKA